MGHELRVKCKRRRLSPGNYRIITTVKAADNVERVTTVKSKKCTVKSKKTGPKRT